MEDTMTDTNDRLTEIRARLDAATPAPWTRFARNAAAPDEDDWYLGHDVHGPPRAQRGQIERVADADLIAHAPDDLAHLLALVDQLQGQLDEARAENARPAAQDRASGPNTPDPYTGEGTAPASPHEPAQAAIDTIARVLVGTDWGDGVPCTDIGPRETVAHLAGQIATLAPAHYREAAASLRALGHDTAADILDNAAADLNTESETTR